MVQAESCELQVASCERQAPGSLTGAIRLTVCLAPGENRAAYARRREAPVERKRSRHSVGSHKGGASFGGANNGRGRAFAGASFPPAFMLRCWSGLAGRAVRHSGPGQRVFARRRDTRPATGQGGASTRRTKCTLMHRMQARRHTARVLPPFHEHLQRFRQRRICASAKISSSCKRSAHCAKLHVSLVRPLSAGETSPLRSKLEKGA